MVPQFQIQSQSPRLHPDFQSFQKSCCLSETCCGRTRWRTRYMREDGRPAVARRIWALDEFPKWQSPTANSCMPCSQSTCSFPLPTLDMEGTGSRFFGSHLHSSALPRLDMAAAASSIQQLGTPYSQTRPPSASSDYSLSPITPRESFSTALRLMDGPGIDVGLSVSFALSVLFRALITLSLLPG